MDWIKVFSVATLNNFCKFYLAFRGDKKGYILCSQLKMMTGKLTHQDIGQMDMYVRMFDDLKRGEDDNPTIGIILCGDKEETVVRYSVLKDSEQLFASKYRLALPAEQELEAEMEQEIRMIEAQDRRGDR